MQLYPKTVTSFNQLLALPIHWVFFFWVDSVGVVTRLNISAAKSGENVFFSFE
jgi:hypothetical protein